MVYRLILAYRGTAYAGWQRQNNALAVQQVVEEALAILLGEPVRLVGASRTDAGVHARGQAAHLELSRPFPERALVHGTNHHLPDDVRVLAARRMRPGFHARKLALGKRYVYRMIRTEVLSPLDAPFAIAVPPGVDVAAMREAVSSLPGRHDFTAFALAGGAHTQPVRTLFRAELAEHGADLRLRLEGDGFLRGAVRGIAGTLLEVGRAKRSPAGFAALLQGRPRGAAGPTAPPQALVLEEVFYAPEWEESTL